MPKNRVEPFDLQPRRAHTDDPIPTVGRERDKRTPTKEGLERYPPDGYYRLDEEDSEPCTCKTDCPMPCNGQCGCSACDAAYQDWLTLPAT